ncbi:receptor-like protein 7 isoform X2 [Pistacia vera]|uniref:receptor-like protein 7 isoform X2 n=1 Tax=Pistacia vera TaxID=55513 RepID=UPI0012639E3F|nr:receptor-like protein 7 isoform X2 [Pistacia vera]
MTPSSNFFSFMHLLVLFSLFNLIVLAPFNSSAQTLCHDDEHSSLLRFKESLVINKSASSDPLAYPKVASWKADEDCCSWDGVTCNEVTGHLIKLDLSSSCLYGSINSTSTLFQLAHLEWLSLADNDFTGSKIPSKIMNLSKLSYLNLSISGFSGQIPSEFLGLSKLETLDTSMNLNLKLQEPGLKSLVEKLTHLKVLILSQVNISSSIPDILASLSSLTKLSLRDCELQGEFPAKIFQLPHLHFLSVRYNQGLFGYLPEFEKSSPLQYMILAGTRFSGSIPSSLGNLTKITYLYLSGNQFSGKLSTPVGNPSSLQELDLSHNTFSSQDSRSLSWMAKYSKLTYLGLSQVNLFGEIPSWLMNLTHLTHLYMSQNELKGPIPYWLMDLSQLEELSLSSNRLIGNIPSQIRNLMQLQVLALGSNKLQGAFPIALYDLENLLVLDLASNNLNSTVDMNMLFYKLKSLKFLILSSNNLSLLTDTKVHTKFPKLSVLQLRSCNLIEFPNFLQNQDQLEILDLSSNKIAGQIPGWFLNLSVEFLLRLNLSNNLLTGFDQHPLSFSWTRLATLCLSLNKFQGPLPVPPLSTMRYLVSYNNLTGEIPPALCNLNQLETLDLSHNNLSGKLPQCSGNFSHFLQLLNLKNNNFSGGIPENFVNGENLWMIDLSQNQLQGKIPRSLASCTKLEFLDLGNNQINDTFPSWLETLPNLKVLILQSNRLRGAIKEPETDSAFLKLRIIDISHNRFTGHLPSKYFQSWDAMKVVNRSSLTYMQDPRSSELNIGIDEMINLLPSIYDYSMQLSTKGIELEYGRISNLLTAIIFSSNKFEGQIPASIANLKGLHFLVLSNNNLKGSIPPSMANLTVLESLDLSNNKLSGQIPQQLEDLTFLSYFNVSNNQLTGRIPQGKQFDTFETTSFDGNPGLCGKQIAKQCGDFPPSKKEEDPAGSKFPLEFGWKIVLTGFASGIIAGVALEHAFSPRIKVLFMKIFERKLMNTFRRKRAHRSTMFSRRSCRTVSFPLRVVPRISRFLLCVSCLCCEDKFYILCNRLMFSNIVKNIYVLISGFQLCSISMYFTLCFQTFF